MQTYEDMMRIDNQQMNLDETTMMNPVVKVQNTW